MRGLAWGVHDPSGPRAFGSTPYARDKPVSRKGSVACGVFCVAVSALVSPSSCTVGWFLFCSLFFFSFPSVFSVSSSRCPTVHEHRLPQTHSRPRLISTSSSSPALESPCCTVQRSSSAPPSSTSLISLPLMTRLASSTNDPRTLSVST